MIELIKDRFRSLYLKDAELLVKAPGRINLIGEHTDYNAGWVLPAAIDKYMYFTFAVNDLNKGRINAVDLHEHAIIDLDNLQKTNVVWVNYFIGILLEFRKKGFPLKGFDCSFTSDIPIGAGMSSSAALECGFMVGMDNMLGSRLDKWEMIDMSQDSNHNFMNIYGGILDQFSLLFGQEGSCMMMDCSDRNFSYQDLDLMEYSIVMFHSKVTHEHTTSGYNERAYECKQIVELLKKCNPSLDSISALSNKEFNILSTDWPTHLKSRAKYIINENMRVKEFGKAMTIGDLRSIGDLLYQSHYGLQHLYEVSCNELDMLVDLTRDIDEILGARMMGGGFGGCTINIIKSDRVEEIANFILESYEMGTGIRSEYYVVNISNGVSIIEL